MNKFLVILMLSFFVSICKGGLLRLRPRSAPTNKIVGGQDVDITELPHQLSLEYYGAHICGASILTSTIAVTAGHCVQGYYISSFRLRAGTSTREFGGTVHSISDIIIHPYYDYLMPDYDVSLLFVSQSFHFDATRQPINICSTEPTSGSLTVSGWGVLSEGSTELPDQLQAVTIPVVSRTECSQIYAPYGGITGRMFCAGSAGHDACQGDSGGPTIRGGVLYGLVSWGYGCGQPGYPGVFTNLANPEIREWIRDVAGV